MMDRLKQQQILEAAKNWFKNVIAPNHIKNTKKLVDDEEFVINPFLVKYLARFLTGKSDPISIAKALIYPRVLATSINTSFGENAQKFISELSETIGSATEGIDIEFIDQVDKRKKYCQVKLGPNTINKDDVITIHDGFSSIKRRAQKNNLSLNTNDMIVGVLYGEETQLSGNYKKLRNNHHYPVYVGKEFWHRLTGSKHFYTELSTAISEIAAEFDGTLLLKETISKLSKSDFIKELADK